MNILAFNGSPRRYGATGQIIEEICKTAQEHGHSYKIINLYQLNFSGCRGCRSCSSGKVEFCQLKDDFTELIPQIIASDCLIIGSPVYFGHITGHTKCLIDRFYTFVQTGFKIRYLEGKKVVTVLTCGAPAKYYQDISDEYFKEWLGKFMKMNIVGQIVLGEQMDDVSLPSATVEQARMIGASLFN